MLASCSPPRSGIKFVVPVHTLERLGYNEGDLFFMLSDDSNCKQEFTEHNYTVMFGQHEGNWQDVRVWTQHVTLYLTHKDARQIEEEVYLCIQFKGKWEPAWKGSYNLPIAAKSFFCNKENHSSMWECFACEQCFGDNRAKIYEHISMYKDLGYLEPVEVEVPRPEKTSLKAEIIEFGVYAHDESQRRIEDAQGAAIEGISTGAILLEQTDKFRFKPGLGIGFRYEVRNLGTYPSNEIEIVAYIPKSDGHSGKANDSTRFKQPLSQGTGIYEIEFIYFFETDSEMVPGEWKFEIQDRENVLTEIEFDVFN